MTLLSMDPIKALWVVSLWWLLCVVLVGLVFSLLIRLGNPPKTLAEVPWALFWFALNLAVQAYLFGFLWHMWYESVQQAYAVLFGG